MIDLVYRLTFVGDVGNFFSEDVDFPGDAVISVLVDSHEDSRKVAFLDRVVGDGLQGPFGHLFVHGADDEGDGFLGPLDRLLRLLECPVGVLFEQVGLDEELQDVADLRRRRLAADLGGHLAKGRSRHDGRQFTDDRAGRVLVVAICVRVDNADLVHAGLAFELLEGGFLFAVVLGVAELYEQGEIGVVEAFEVHGAGGLSDTRLAQACLAVADQLQVRRRGEPGEACEFAPREVGTSLAFFVEVLHVLAVILIFDYGFHIKKNKTKLLKLQQKQQFLIKFFI